MAMCALGAIAVGGCLALLDAVSGLTAGRIVPAPGSPPAPAAMPPAAPLGEVDVGSPAIGTTREDVHTGDDAARTLRVYVRQDLARSWPHYTGPLVIEVDGAVVAQPTLSNGDAIDVPVPARSRSLCFRAPDHEPAVLSLPLPPPRPRATVDATVKLVPAGAVQIRVVGLAPIDGVTPRLDVSLVTSGLYAARGEWTGELTGEQILRYVLGEPFHWDATLVVGQQRFSWSGDAAALRAGEPRELALDVAAVRRERFRLVGASPELCALVTARRQYEVGGGTAYEEVTFGGDGTCELTARPDASWSCCRLPLRAECRPEETWLSMDGGLVALGMRGADGKPVATRLYTNDGIEAGMQREQHVLARAAVAPSVWLGPTFAESIEVVGGALPVDRDVVWLEAGAAPHPGRVQVVVAGSSPAAKRPPGTSVHVEAGEQYRRQFQELEFAVPVGRTIDVRWRIGGNDGPWIARGLRVERGEVREVAADWPVAQTWKGSVAGFAELPAHQRWHRVSWGEPAPNRMWQGMERLAGEGTFALVLPAGAPLPGWWELFAGQVRIAAGIAEVDDAARTFVLRPLQQLQWVTPVVEVPPPWVLMSAGVARRWPNFLGRHDDRRPVPVPAGEVVHGVVLTNQRAVAWFTLDSRAPDAPIRACGGRTIEVRMREPDTTRWICLCGPHGQLDAGLEVNGTKPLRLFVPTGTRSLAVFDNDRPNDSPYEVPLPAGDVAVID